MVRVAHSGHGGPLRRPQSVSTDINSYTTQVSSGQESVSLLASFSPVPTCGFVRIPFDACRTRPHAFATTSRSCPIRGSRRHRTASDTGKWRSAWVPDRRPGERRMRHDGGGKTAGGHTRLPAAGRPGERVLTTIENSFVDAFLLQRRTTRAIRPSLHSKPRCQMRDRRAEGLARVTRVPGTAYSQCDIHPRPEPARNHCGDPAGRIGLRS